MLETTSVFGGTGSTDIRRRRTSKTVLEPSTSDYQTITANFGQKHHLPQNWKWKYVENPILQLATVDFLFDFNTMYGSIGHRFNARNCFRSRRNQKYKNLTTADLNNASRPVYEALQSTFGGLKPFQVKPEVEIWWKPKKWTRKWMTSYLTPIQCMGLSATILTLETTSSLIKTGSTEIWRRPTLETVLDGSPCD